MKAGLQALYTRSQRCKLEKDLPVEQPAPALYFKNAQFQEPGFVTKGVFSLPLYEACIKKFRNANADGEPAEQLWIRVAKEDFLANLTFICRAEEHARVTVIEGATADCKWFYDLVQDWVLACRRTDTCPGGYARALTNSPKLQKRYEARLLESQQSAFDGLGALYDAAAAKKTSLAFGPTRWDTVVDPLTHILSEIRVHLLVLAEDFGNWTWAQNLLDWRWPTQHTHTAEQP